MQFLLLAALLMQVNPDLGEPEESTPEQTHKATRSLTVGLVGQAPFLVNRTNGIANDLWAEVIRKHNKSHPTQTILYDTNDPNTVADLENIDWSINSMEANDIDVLIGPITITSERAKKAPFMYPYYQAKMGVMTKTQETWWGNYSSFMFWSIFKGLMIFIVTLFISGTIVWAIERKDNPDFDPTWKGIFDGSWWSLVTTTTVGYGDKLVKTVLGKFYASFWMVIGIMKYPALTSFLTVGGVKSLNETNWDIGKQKVAAVEGTTGMNWALASGAKKVKIEVSLKEAILSLEQGHVDGVVFDAPVLNYYLSQNPGTGFEVYDQDASEQYGFIVRDPVLASELNVSLLKIIENKGVERIVQKWLYH